MANKEVNIGRPSAVGFQQHMLTSTQASSSGTEGQRIVFRGGAYSRFGLEYATTGTTGTITVQLSGSVATSSDASANALLTLSSTQAILMATESTAQPVNQVWVDVTANPSSVSMDVYLSATP